MFNKKPIFDRMDVHMMSEYDGSEISYGHHSVVTKRPVADVLTLNPRGTNMAS